MKATNPSNAGDVKTSENDTLSFEEFVAQRTRLAMGEEEPEQSEAPEPATEEEEGESQEIGDDLESDEGEGVEEAEDDSEDSEPEASDIDLLNLSPEQIQELAKKGKSRLLQRIGELTAKTKTLEEQLQKAQPVAKEIPQESNPFSKIQSMDELKAKYEELEKTLDATDRLLDEYDDYTNSDVISVGDKEFTKLEIKKANRNAKEALHKYLPAQHAHLSKLNQFAELSVQYQEAAKSEVPEIANEETEIGKRYKELVSDPLVEKVKQEVPEIGFQIEYILAHAARSIFGGKSKLQTGAGQRLKVEPPSSPVGAGAAKSGKNLKAKGQEVYKRFESTGSVDDWVAARIARMQK
jgi:hypothetical protein